MCMFCRSLFILLSLFFWSLCCLFFDLWVLIASLVSSNNLKTLSAMIKDNTYKRYWRLKWFRPQQKNNIDLLQYLKYYYTASLKWWIQNNNIMLCINQTVVNTWRWYCYAESFVETNLINIVCCNKKIIVTGNRIPLDVEDHKHLIFNRDRI